MILFFHGERQVIPRQDAEAWRASGWKIFEPFGERNERFPETPTVIAGRAVVRVWTR